MDTTKKPPRSGFTLVEMLAVVVIIAILAALITAAAIAARRRAKIAVINMEINQLDMAVKAYKEKFGDYPPDFYGILAGDTTAQNLVLRHIRKAFPRYVVADWAALQADVDAGTIANPLNINDLTPASALVFWLGGLPDANGRLTGFCADPQNPFTLLGSRIPMLFEFDPDRLDLTNNRLWYAPDTGGNNVPYVYFKARQQEYGTVSGTTFIPFFCTYATDNICVAYLASTEPVTDLPTVPLTVRNWNNEKTFQIISAGLDGQFGDRVETEFRFSKSGLNFSPNGGDYDNQTNFCKGTLEDELP